MVQFVPHYKGRVSGLASECIAWGGPRRASDLRGRLLGVGRADGTQRCGHIWVFSKKTESPNLSEGRKIRSRMCSANSSRHIPKRVASKELGGQSPQPEGTPPDGPFSHLSVSLETLTAISFIRDVCCPFSVTVLLILLLSFFISHFPQVLLPFHHGCITYHLPCPSLVK